MFACALTNQMEDLFLISYCGWLGRRSQVIIYKCPHTLGRIKIVLVKTCRQSRMQAHVHTHTMSTAACQETPRDAVEAMHEANTHKDKPDLCEVI